MPDLSWLRRLRGSFRTRAFERQMSAELAAHLEFEADALIAAGWSAADARLEAVRRFGSVAETQDRCRDSWGIQTIDAIAQDLRDGLRAFARSPGSAALIVLTLGVGIGLTTTIFSAVHAVLLQRLPYANGEALIEIRQQKTGDPAGNIGLSLPELEDYRQQATSLDAIVEYHQMWFNLIEGSKATRVMTGVVSAGFFDVVGVRPFLGRTFVPDDERPDAVPVLVVSHSYWQRALGADPHVVGRAVEMNDRVHRIVGVLPAVPQFPEDSELNDVYMPVSACPFHARAVAANDRRMRIVSAIGRIKPGQTPDDVQRELSALAGSLSTAFPDAYPAGLVARAERIREQLTARARPTLTALMAASLCVLLLVCANVGHLMLSRLVPRQLELRLRGALGATPLRLVRQLMIEAGALAAAGGAMGVALAALARSALTSYALRLTPRASEIAIDRTVLLFAAGVTILATLAFGLVPAWRVARTPASLEKRPAPWFLIVPQVAISLLLLAVSLQMTRHLIAVITTDPGFNPDHVLTAQVDLDWTRYSTDDARRTFYRSLLERIDRTPDIGQAGLSLTFPLNDGGARRAPITIEGDAPDTEMPPVDVRLASPGYFGAVGMTVLEGQSFSAADQKPASAVALVNRSLALRRFHGDAVGRRLSIDDGRSWLTIVGTVNDVRQYGLEAPAVDELYLPFDRYAPLSATLLVRTSKDSESTLRQVEDIVRSLDPRQPLGRVRTLTDVRDSSVAAARLTTTLVLWLAAVAVFISAAGVAGAVWFSVNQRAGEIGIRLALGESRRRIALRVAASGLGPVLVGLTCGAPLVLAADRFKAAGSVIESVGQGTMAVAVVVIVAAAAVACLAPARRAMDLNPITALRAE
jgi:predicted permease